MSPLPSQTKPIRLVLADDHLVLRQALRALLEQRGLDVVADEADGRAAGSAVQRYMPDVAGLDGALPVPHCVGAAPGSRPPAPPRSGMPPSRWGGARLRQEAPQ